LPAAGARDRETRTRPEDVDAPGSAEPFLPLQRDLDHLRAAAATCRGCALYARATQTVFGEGPVHPEVFFVGEQPGDYEDQQGRPFVGPAGQLLERALAKAGIERSKVYVTNAVKHFKWEPRGKRRIHNRPNAKEIAACRPWLDAELDAVKPTVVVCLGAVAAQALLGASFSVLRQRGQLLSANGLPVMATVHPASVLRAPDEDARHAAELAFERDIESVVPIIRASKAA